MTMTNDPQADQRPAAATELARRLGVTLDRGPATIKLRQTGRMKRALDSPSWMGFRAEQTISTTSCAFDWRARFGPLGLVTARDALANGRGRLDIDAFGLLPISHMASTPALLRGELMRYLAELAWAPQAILQNPALRWRDQGPDALVVSAGDGATACDVTLTFNREGRIAGARASDRPRSVGCQFVPTPWEGEFSDYRQSNGCWIPFSGEVAWVINGQREVYWQGKLTSWEIL